MFNNKRIKTLEYQQKAHQRLFKNDATMVIGFDNAVRQFSDRVKNLESDNKELRMQLEKLQWRMDNPPKYNIGDITKNRIVTKVEVLNHVNLTGFSFTDESKNLIMVDWYHAYHVTHRSTGETSVILD